MELFIFVFKFKIMVGILSEDRKDNDQCSSHVFSRGIFFIVLNAYFTIEKICIDT